ncbi:hypothetical protein GCM10009847_02720 [Leucobacter tardus]|uniref:YceI family protein n=1 Tax=Leucobacter tardus TaxID=501483 RepID=A0A939TIT3_9MICO|nr:YceI family protein [Leucobacter tardus]MBO2988481.1 YceI family protein [Leucobacter tardus]
MKKSQKIWIGVGAGVLVLGVAAAVAGPIVYRDLVVAPAAEAPTVTAPAPSTDDGSSGDALDPAALVGTWNVTDGSEAGYRVDEVLNGTDVTVTGRTGEVSGALTIGESGLTLDAAEITVDVASIATDSENRDEYFRGEALRTDEFPEATFMLTDPVTFDTAPESGQVVETEATGELTIAGETRTVTAQIQLTSDGETAQIAGAIPITFADYGVEAPNLGFVSVEPEGSVEFQLVAARG